MALVLDWDPKMKTSDKTFYKALGQWIAQYSKKQGLTQVQLAEKPATAQQTMAHYEGDSLRIAVALLKPLAQELNVSIEELIEEPKTAAKGKRGPSSKLQQQVGQVSHMPRSKQKFISEILDALIVQRKAG